MSGVYAKGYMKEIAFREAMSFRNMRISARQCARGVSWKPSVQLFEIDALQWTATLHKQILDHSYKSRGFYEFWIKERGKMRFIRSVHVTERCVQKCANNFGVKPLVEPRLIYDNSASRKNKGTDFAIKRLRKHLATHYRKHRKEGGILTFDFRDFFNRIPHKRLYEVIRRIVPDRELYCLMCYFMACFGTRGLGLGSELSQIAAVLYPDILDHYIKERLHIKGYARYMDDGYLIHHDLDYLKQCLNDIREIVEEIGLELNPKTKITKFDGGTFVFLKRRFSFSDTGKIVTRLSRQNTTAQRQTMHGQKRKLDEGSAKLASIRQSYASYRGHAIKWDSRATVARMDVLYFELFGDGGSRAEQKYYRTTFEKGEQNHVRRKHKRPGSGGGKRAGGYAGQNRKCQKRRQRLRGRQRRGDQCQG